VLASLRKLRPDLAHVGYGGARMAGEGFDLRYDLAGDAVMGIFPVIKALPRILRLLREAEERLRRDRPAAVVLVDYPGFNFRLAAAAKRLGIPVLWYIAPQVWAWGAWRMRKVARLVDRLLCILPFEEALFRGAGVDARYVGHPVVDHLAESPRDAAVAARLAAHRGAGPLIGVFPGSRGHVLDSLLPDFRRVVDAVLRAEPHARFALAVAAPRFAPKVEAVFGDEPRVLRVVGKSPDVMDAVDFALTTSGTTTLELACAGKPFVIGYRVSPVFYAVARSLVRVGHIGLANLVAEQTVAPEHVGSRSLAAALTADLLRYVRDPSAAAAARTALNGVRMRLDVRGAYAHTAAEFAAFLASRGA
jgi:lipid-A-disaccharide synthase